VRISVVSPAECTERAVSALDVDPYADLLSAEGLAASLRRAASYLCPASPRQVTDSVMDAIRPLATDGEPQRQDIAEILDLLVAGGDLIELRRADNGGARLLYLGPPSYIEAHAGRYLVTGIRPFGAPLIGTGLPKGTRIQYEGHTRTIDLPPNQVPALLAEAGLHRIRRDHWLRQPAEVTAADLASRMRQRLAACRPDGHVDGLTVIGQETKVTYYRGRWRPLASADSGLLVGRRPQAYGADAWCLVLAGSGASVRILDLPTDDPSLPGRDEAWRVQAALDADRGVPQVFRVSSTGRASGKTIDFFSPLPQWAERYLQLAGMAVPKSRGALFSYRIHEDALPDLTGFLASMLWMSQTTTEGAE
jgi:hypothetical protein